MTKEIYLRIECFNFSTCVRRSCELLPSLDDFSRHHLLWKYCMDLDETSHDFSFGYPARSLGFDFCSVEKHGQKIEHKDQRTVVCIFLQCWSNCPFWTLFCCFWYYYFQKSPPKNYCTDFNESWYDCPLGYSA